MAGISVGSVSVSVVPNVSRFATDLRAKLVPSAAKIGDEIGKTIGQRIRESIGDPLGDWDRKEQSKAPGRGSSQAGAFADAFKARLRAALSDLPKAKLDVDSSDADFQLAQIRADMAELSGKRIGIDISDEAALVQLDNFKERLDRLAAESPSVSVNVNTARASAELAKFRAELAAVGRTRETATVDIKANDRSGILSGGGAGGRGGLWSNLIMGGAVTAAAFAPQLAALSAGILGVAASLGAGATAAGAFGAVAIPMFKDVTKASSNYATAGKAVDTAQRNYNDAVAKFGPNSAQAKAALDQLNKAQQAQQATLNGLSPSERQLAKDLNGVKAGWEGVNKALQPVVMWSLQPWFDVVSRGMQFLSPLVRGAATAINVLGGEAKSALANPWWDHFFGVLGNSGRIAIQGFGEAAGYAASGLAHLFVTFAPWIDKIAPAISRWAQSFADWAASYNRAGFDRFMARIQAQGPTVRNIFSLLWTDLTHVASALRDVPNVSLLGLENMLAVLSRLSPGQIQALAYVAAAAKVGGMVKGLVSGVQSIYTKFSDLGMQKAGDTMVEASVGMQRAADTMAGASRVAGGEAAAGGAAAKGGGALALAKSGLLGVGATLLGTNIIGAMAPQATRQQANTYKNATPGWVQGGLGVAFGGQQNAQNVSGALQKSKLGQMAGPDTEIPNWWSTGYETFMREVGSPVANWFTTSLPHAFTAVVPRMWSGGFQGFMNYVGSPIANWFTTSLPHFFTVALPRTFGSLAGAGANLMNTLWQGIQSGWAWVWAWISRIGSWIGGAFASAGSWLWNAGYRVIQGLSGGIQAAWNWIWSWIWRIGGWIGSAFAAAGSWLWNAGYRVIQGLSGGIQAAWNWVWSWIWRIGGWIGSAFAAAGSWLWNAGYRVIQGLSGGIQAAWNWVWAWIWRIGGWITSAFVAAGTWLWNSGYRVIQGLSGGIQTAWAWVWAWISRIYGWVTGYFASAGAWLWNHGYRIIQGLSGGIQTAWAWLWGWINRIYGWVTGYFGSAAIWLWSHGYQIIQGLSGGIQNAWAWLWGWINRIYGWISGYFSGAWNWLWQHGHDITAGLWDGIKNGLGSAWNWIKAHIFQPIVDAIKGLFGIHSPSTVFAEYGGHIMNGFILGILKGKGGLDAIIKNIFGGGTNAMADLLNKGIIKVGSWISKFPDLMGKLSSSILGALGQFFAKAVGAAGSGVQRWAGVVYQALALLHMSPSLAGRVLYQMQTESGGNPNAVNNWDSNAAAGHPSMGLMQVIGPTFSAYHVPGTSWNILDPLANIAAGINYAAHAYGPSLGALGSGHGYAMGTTSASAGWHWVGENGPELLRFSGGEQVVPSGLSASMAKGGDGAKQPLVGQIIVPASPGASAEEIINAATFELRKVRTGGAYD